MAHHPMSRPGATDPRVEAEGPRPFRAPLSSEEERELTEKSGLHLAELAAALASHGGGAASNDLALDLVLNEIVEQARLASTATGAAVALFRDGELVCRATTGANAPELGVRLNRQSGLSGACAQSGEVQSCNDAESDPRVDAAACRSLGLRSILVVPVLTGETVLGVFEIFSPRPNAFGERDIQTVQALCWRIVSNMERAAERAASPVVVSAPLSLPTDNAAPLVSQTSVLSEPDLPEPALPESAPPEQEPGLPVSRDYGTGILTAIVVSLALLLGWMVGRAGWRSGASRAQPPVVAPAQAKEQLSRGPNEKAASSEKVGPDSVTPSAVPMPPPSPPSVSNRPNVSSSDALVVYEKGKVIFHKESSKPHDSTTGAIRNAGEVVPLPVSPEKANANLIHRVEPEYPEEARALHIQGAVVLEAVVGSDGVVREVKRVSGDEVLAAAAADAVRQWRFKPYDQAGQAIEFQTQITVNFKLP